jgi:hypothetical protein
MVKMHKDYDSEDFAWDEIEKAWQAINGLNHFGRYFFVAHLKKTPSNGDGRWMAYLRRPGIKVNGEDDSNYLDVPFEYQGFVESGEAGNAIHHRAYRLGWRISEIDVNALPEEIDENTKSLLGLRK